MVRKEKNHQREESEEEEKSNQFIICKSVYKSYLAYASLCIKAILHKRFIPCLIYWGSSIVYLKYLLEFVIPPCW